MRRAGLVAAGIFLAAAGCNWLLGFEDDYRVPFADGGVDANVDAPAVGTDAGAPCTANTLDDENNCGRCGNVCASNLGCNQGRCGTIRRVVAGGHFACVLRDDGRVKCWGDNEAGQLATDPALTVARAEPRTIDNIDIERFESIATGFDFACGTVVWSLKNKRHTNVVCWGSNEHQQLGHPRGKDDDDEARTVCENGSCQTLVYNWHTKEIQVAQDMALQGISAGSTAACALGDPDAGGGRTYCWGDNFWRQRGTPEEDAGVAPNRVSGEWLHDFLALSGPPDTRACARVRDGGTVQCWGSNRGSLGDDVSGWRIPTPVTVRTDPANMLSGVTELVSLRGSSCALANDAVFCWGTSDTGIFGIDPPRRNPFAIRGPQNLPPIVKLSGSDGHVCALATDGKVWCWGMNGSGQLGRGHAGGEASCGSERCEPIPAPIRNFDAVDISAGYEFTVALRADGTVWTWGSGHTQKLGRPLDPDAGDLNECQALKPCSPTPRPVVGME